MVETVLTNQLVYAPGELWRTRNEDSQNSGLIDKWSRKIEEAGNPTYAATYETLWNGRKSEHALPRRLEAVFTWTTRETPSCGCATKRYRPSTEGTTAVARRSS